MRKASPSAWRVQSLDVLRGIAIIGTLLSNIWIFTFISDSGEERSGTFGSWQEHVSSAAEMVANGKFLALLSILFGVGMAIQFDAARRHGHRWPWRYEWRSLLLLADGFLHFALVFAFDILMGYALVAMVVAPLLLLRTRWLVLAAALVGAFHLFTQVRELLWPSTGERDIPADGMATPDTYFGEVAYRVTNFWELRIEAFEIAPPLSAFLFLTGAVLWRTGLFRSDSRARTMSVWLAVGGLGLGAPLTLWGHVGLPGAEVVSGMSRYVVAPVVAFGYLGLVLLLLRRGGGHGFLSRQLAAVGRTALSCYMLQNVIAMVGFSTWGLTLGPLDNVESILAWAVISALLMLAASLWLRRFDQGPFEWVWKVAVDAPFRRRDRRPNNQESTAPSTVP